MLETFVDNVAWLRAFNFIEKKLQHSCFTVKFAKFLRTPTFKNVCERLLLYLHVILFTMHEKDTANNAGLELSYTFFSKTVNDLLFPQKNCIIDI